MYYTTINGRKYAFDLEKLKKVCIISQDDETKEKEITEVTEPNDEDEMEVSSRVIREVKYPGNSQNDAIMFDMIKMFITKLIDNDLRTETELDFSTSLCINTLLKCGALVEIND